MHAVAHLRSNVLKMNFSYNLYIFVLLFPATIAARISDGFETIFDDEDYNLDLQETSKGHLKKMNFICNNICTRSGSGSGSGDSFEGSTFSGAELPHDGSTKHEVIREIHILKEKINQLIKALDSSKSNEKSIPVEYKTAYPIFLAKSVDGNYRLTQDEAEILCQQEGGVLASHMQMQTAWEKGMDVCSCGWVAEGHAIYPIQYPREGCTPELGPGIRLCTWKHQWNAWCFSKTRLEKNI